MTNSARELNDQEFMSQLEELIALVSEARELLGRLDLNASDMELFEASQTIRPH